MVGSYAVNTPLMAMVIETLLHYSVDIILLNTFIVHGDICVCVRLKVIW